MINNIIFLLDFLEEYLDSRRYFGGILREVSDSILEKISGEITSLLGIQVEIHEGVVE